MVILKSAALLDCLKPYHPQSNLQNDGKIGVSTLGLFDQKTPPSASKVLFIGFASDLPANPSPQHDINLICIANSAVPGVYFENSLFHLITLDSKAELTAVYNAVNVLFNSERQLTHATDRLFQSVINDCSLQQICDISYELLENPVVILDNALKIIVWTSNGELDDPIWTVSNQTDGYISNESLLLLINQSDFKQDFHQTSPMLAKKGQLKYRRLITHIFVDQKAIGTMVVIESENQFKETDFQIVDLIAKVLSLEMKKDSFILYSKGLADERVLKDLLDGNHDNTPIRQQFKTQHPTSGKNLYSLTIDISELDRTYKTLQYFRELLDKMIFNCKSLIYNDYIVMIIMHDNEVALSKTELERLTAFFSKNNLYGGISRCFHDILEIRAHFNQAVTAAAFSRRFKNKNRLSFYQDVSIYHLIEQAAQKIDPQQLCHESVLKLIEYDRQNNTPYTQNLYQYLINERNLAHTTHALHIHRNTLIYRINKISELIKVDLEDSEVRLQLLITYKILDLFDNA